MKLQIFQLKNLVRFELFQHEFEGDLKTLQEMFEMFESDQIGIILDKKNNIVQVSTNETIYVVCSRSGNIPHFLTYYIDNVLRFVNNEVNIVDSWFVQVFKGDNNIDRISLKSFRNGK